VCLRQSGRIGAVLNAGSGIGMRQRKSPSFYRNMTKEKAEEIRRLYFSRQKKQVELAEMFGIKQNTVSRIISGMVWA
jgi:DNA-binding MarR family transcriptional regulator